MILQQNKNIFNLSIPSRMILWRVKTLDTKYSRFIEETVTEHTTQTHTCARVKMDAIKIKVFKLLLGIFIGH